MSTKEPPISAGSTAHRSIRGRRQLPGSRAVVGGLLVTVAVLGTFAAYSSADEAPADSIVVLRTSVTAGQRLTTDDVTVEPADLPDDVIGRSFGRAEAIEDAVALAPMEAGEIVQQSAVLLRDETGAAGEPTHDFSLPVERDRALNGQLARGEIVDVLATYGTGELAYTAVVARRAQVVEVADTSSGLGSDGIVVVTLALSSADEVMSTTHASVTAEVTIVRATRASEQGGPDRYSPTAATGGVGR